MKSRTKIIAEIGNTHEGSLGLAKCFIKAAANCGIDAVKFQTHIFEAESLPDAPNPPYFSDETRQEFFDRVGFNQETWRKLKIYAEEQCKVDFLSSPFSLEAVDLLESIDVKAYKIASGEVTNLPLLAKIAGTGKSVLLSSGMSSWSELDEAIETLTNSGCRDLVILQCTSEYPCPPEASGLNVLLELKKRYDLPVGLSDHTIGSAVSIAAVAMGATVIEKHFTLSKQMYGPDAKFSMTPSEFKMMVEGIRDVEAALTMEIDKDQKATSLRAMRDTFQKSVVAKLEIAAGTTIEEHHLAFKKPGTGIPANRFKDLIGRKTIKNIQKNKMIDWDMLSSKKNG
jgi:sialic acid synthase SpsE